MKPASIQPSRLAARFRTRAVPHAAGMQAIVDDLRRQGLHPSPLPLGLLRPGEDGGCVLCNTCNSFPCKLGAKSDADVCCVRPALQHPNVTLWTGAWARRLITDGTGRQLAAVEVERGGEVVTIGARWFVVSCGAANSAALLLRSATETQPEGLANSSGLVGRRYMAHLATMMQGFNPFRRNDTVFQKTVAINDYYFRGPHSRFPLGHIQSQGRTHGVMAKVVGDTIVPGIPLGAYEAWVSRGVDWLVMSEDLPTPENRVMLDAQGRIRLHYQPNNVTAHEQLVVRNPAHPAAARFLEGDCAFASGAEHHASVRHPVLRHRLRAPRCSTRICRAHDVDNLFVVDASFFPSSAAVNPALTIVAQALRVADHLIDTDLGA